MLQSIIRRPARVALVWLCLFSSSSFSNHVVQGQITPSPPALSATTYGSTADTSNPSRCDDHASSVTSSSSSSLLSVASIGDDGLIALPDSNNQGERTPRTRKLQTTSHYTRIGSGYCNGDINRNRVLTHKSSGSSPFDYEDCIEHCGSQKGFTYIKVDRSNARDYHHCICQRYTYPVTGFSSNRPGGLNLKVNEGTAYISCYAYNKGDQLRETNKASKFYFAGQGRCIGTVDEGSFQYDSKNIRNTDYACAQQCDSSSYIGFQRTLSGLLKYCNCLKPTDGRGDITYTYNNAYSCYIRLMNRVGGTSGFEYAGYGMYGQREPQGTAQTDAECAKKCLDANIEGIVGITHEKKGGACYCATGGTRSEDKTYSSYSIDISTRVLSCPDNSALLTILSYGKTTLTSQCRCTDTVGTAKTLSIQHEDTCNCPSETSWCSEDDNDKLYLDCDGDGNLDSLCIFGLGYHMLKSQNQCNTVTEYNSDVAPRTKVITDCPAANYGNQDLGDFSSHYFWTGAGPCFGSSNNQQFSSFEVREPVTSDQACAEICRQGGDVMWQGQENWRPNEHMEKESMRLERMQKVVAFSRRVSSNTCFCHFQKDTTYLDDIEVHEEQEVVDVHHEDGVGGVVAGNDNRYSCYGHYQSENQLVDARTRFLVGDGRSRFELKGNGPCRDRRNHLFPQFQIANHDNDDECLQNCLSAFEDTIGITRNKKNNQCFCHYDYVTNLATSITENSSYTKRNGTGTGEVLEGWLKDFSCLGRVEGRSGFDFKGIGRCRDSSNNRFPYFQINGNETSHSDAECAQSCLEAFPTGIVGITRHKRDFDCYCAYSSETTLPSSFSSHTVSWSGGGTGAVVAGTDDELEYSCYGIDETSRVTDCPPNSVVTTELDSNGLKSLEAWCDCDNSAGKDVYRVGESCNCARPYGWCTEPGDEYFHLDCDGDTTLDSVCVNDEGYMTLQSTNACNKQEGTGDVGQQCPLANGCSRPNDWCGGGEYSFLDCDGDGVKDSFCRDTDNYWIRESSNGCNESSGPVSGIAVVCPALNACTRPDTWCTERNNRYFFIDCDGDGALDSLCERNKTNYLLRTSAGGCVDSSYNDETLAAACPAAGCVRPKAWCGHFGSQYYYTDCDGDGKLDSHCRGDDGRTWAILSGRGCKRTRDRCPAADYCIHRSDWCNHAGSHFYWADPRGVYGNDESRCIINIGQDWKDTTCYRNLTDVVGQDRNYILSKT